MFHKQLKLNFKQSPASWEINKNICWFAHKKEEERNSNITSSDDDDEFKNINRAIPSCTICSEKQSHVKSFGFNDKSSLQNVSLTTSEVACEK